MTTDTTNALRALAAEYRPSMNADVLHAWAADVIAALTTAQPCVGCEGKPAPENSPCGVCGAAAQPGAKPEGVDSAEDAYVIEQMGRLLAEIAVIVKGPEPANGLWSYHDLPKLVAQIKQATYRSPCCGVGEGELHRDDCTAQIADEMDAWAEKRLSGPHDNRNVRRLLNGWAERLRATRQAQGGESKPKLRSGFVSPLQDPQTIPGLRQAQGAHAYKTPDSEQSPGDVHRESAEVDIAREFMADFREP